MSVFKWDVLIMHTEIYFTDHSSKVQIYYNYIYIYIGFVEGFTLKVWHCKHTCKHICSLVTVYKYLACIKSEFWCPWMNRILVCLIAQVELGIMHIFIWWCWLNCIGDSCKLMPKSLSVWEQKGWITQRLSRQMSLQMTSHLKSIWCSNSPCYKSTIVYVPRS